MHLLRQVCQAALECLLSKQLNPRAYTLKPCAQIFPAQTVHI